MVIKAYGEQRPDYPNVPEEVEAYDWKSENISYEDFLKLAEGSDKRYEYIDGEVYLLASPSFAHQNIVMEISNVMYNWFKGKKCRPLTALFDIALTINECKNVVQPDIMVICDTENINDKGKYLGIPTLVVEVLSESILQKDFLKKVNLYFYGGVKEYWTVSPWRKEVYLYCFEEQDIEEYRVYKGNEAVQSLTFEGLEVPLKGIFIGV